MFETTGNMPSAESTYDRGKKPTSIEQLANSLYSEEVDVSAGMPLKEVKKVLKNQNIKVAGRAAYYKVIEVLEKYNNNGSLSYPEEEIVENFEHGDVHIFLNGFYQYGSLYVAPYVKQEDNGKFTWAIGGGHMFKHGWRHDFLAVTLDG